MNIIIYKFSFTLFVLNKNYIIVGWTITLFIRNEQLINVHLTFHRQTITNSQI